MRTSLPVTLLLFFSQAWAATLTVAPVGNGVITGPGINCPPLMAAAFQFSDCSETVADGTPVVLTAAPWPEYAFASWSGCDQVNLNQCSVTLTTDRSVTALFVPIDPPGFSSMSTRGLVLTGNDVMIAGFIVPGTKAKPVVVNVAGPHLANFGIANALANPTLTIVRSADNTIIASNDDWQSQADPADVVAIRNSGFQPNNALEPAVFLRLQPGAYTAIVQGVSGGTGVGLVGVFAVP